MSGVFFIHRAEGVGQDTFFSMYPPNMVILRWPDFLHGIQSKEALVEAVGFHVLVLAAPEPHILLVSSQGFPKTEGGGIRHCLFI
jgi:hypothetical protein